MAFKEKEGHEGKKAEGMAKKQKMGKAEHDFGPVPRTP